MTTTPDRPKRPWHVLKSVAVDANLDRAMTFAETSLALDWHEDSVPTQLAHAQELLDDYDLPPGLRHELQSFVESPDVWVTVPDDQRQAVDAWLEEHADTA